MRIRSTLPPTRTQSDIERLREKIRIATVRGVEPLVSCPSCRIARDNGRLAWCRCIRIQLEK